MEDGDDSQWATSREIRDAYQDSVLISAIDGHLERLASHGLLLIKAGSSRYVWPTRTETKRGEIFPSPNLVMLDRTGRKLRIKTFTDTMSAKVAEPNDDPDERPEVADLSCIALRFFKPDLERNFPHWGSKVVPLTKSESDKEPAMSAAGAKLDSSRWADFAAALAVVAHNADAETFRSRAKLYNAVSDYLVQRGRDAMDEKNVRAALDLARNWIDQGDDPDKWPKAD